MFGRSPLDDLLRGFGVRPSLRRRMARATGRLAWKATHRTVRWSLRRGWTHRRNLAPFYGVLTLVILGGIGRYIPDGGFVSVPLWMTGGVILAGWQGYRAVRANRGGKRPLRRREVLYGWAVHLSGLGLLLGVTTAGLRPWIRTTLVLWLVAVGSPWWLRHRIRRTEPAGTVQEAPWRVTWDTEVTCDGGAIPGAELHDDRPLREDDPDAGFQGRIRMPRGKTTTTAINATEQLAAAFDLPITSVVVDRPLDGSMRWADLSVYLRNPLQQVQTFEHPTLDVETGWCTVGRFADGTDAKWRLYIPGSGLCHGLIFGTTGAGKSGLINALLTEIRHSKRLATFLADAKDGESVPDYQDNVACFGGSLWQIRRMLQAAERIMDGNKRRRSRRIRIDEQGRERRGYGFFDPTPEEPGLVVIIEESPDILKDPECVRIVGRILKKGRSLGVAIILVAQVPSAVELGGDTMIRSMASSFNVAAFRTSDKDSKQMGSPVDLPVDPRNLPVYWPDGSSTAGLGYLAAAGARVAPWRGLYVEDPYGWATCGEPAELTLEQQADAGEYYRMWRDWRELDEDPKAKKAAKGTGDGATSTPSEAEVEAAVGSYGDRILAFLTDHDTGLVTTGVLRQALGAKHLNTISQACGRLAKKGLLVDKGHGLWARLDAAEVDEAEMAGVA